MRLIVLPQYCIDCQRNVEIIPVSKESIKIRCGCGSATSSEEELVRSGFMLRTPLDDIDHTDQGGVRPREESC